MSHPERLSYETVSALERLRIAAAVATPGAGGNASPRMRHRLFACIDEFEALQTWWETTLENQQSLHNSEIETLTSELNWERLRSENLQKDNEQLSAERHQDSMHFMAEIARFTREYEANLEAKNVRIALMEREVAQTATSLEHLHADLDAMNLRINRLNGSRDPSPSMQGSSDSGDCPHAACIRSWRSGNLSETVADDRSADEDPGSEDGRDH